MYTPYLSLKQKLKKYHFSKSLQKTIKIPDRTAKLSFEKIKNESIQNLKKKLMHIACVSV